MATADDKIKEVLARYGEPFTQGQGGNVWRVQGVAVISHKTLERIAAQAKITFDQPTILRSERDEAVILVTGMIPTGKKLEDEQPDAPDWVHGPTYRTEWSIGEALVNVNYRVSGKQAAYVYAMAEKRAKDRVILKLVELHGLAYSEEEADEFRQQGGNAQPAPAPAPDLRNVHDLHHNGKPIQRNASQETAGRMLTKLWTISGSAVGAWLSRDDVRRALEGLDEVDRHRVEDLAEERSVIQGEEAVAQ